MDKSYVFSFEITKKERNHLIEKASICVNGISLTISKVTKKGFEIWVIPHTFKETNLMTLLFLISPSSTKAAISSSKTCLFLSANFGNLCYQKIKNIRFCHFG